jgi:hypothetical protein
MERNMNKKVGTALGIAATGLVLSMLLTGPVQAAASKFQSVFVTNTVDEPVPTKAVDRQQYTTQVDVFAPAMESEVCSDDPPVPAGKRMIVDTVVAEVRDGEQAPNLFLSGHGARPYLSLAKVQDAGDAPGSWVSGSHTYWGATEQLHLVFGETPSGSVGQVGTAQLTAQVCIHPKGETRYARVQFTGVLEDL